MSNFPIFFNHTRQEVLHGQIDVPSDVFKHGDNPDSYVAHWHLFNIFWGPEDHTDAEDECAFGHNESFANRVKDYTSAGDRYRKEISNWDFDLIDMRCTHCGKSIDVCEENDEDECWDASFVPTPESIIRATHPTLLTEGSTMEEPQKGQMLKVFVLGLFEDTATTHRYPVIESYESWLPIEKILENTREKYNGDPRVHRLFLKDEAGNRLTYKSSTDWQWKQYSLAYTDVKLAMSPAGCARCGGLGTVNYGNWTTHYRGRDMRLCFVCKGRGF